MQLVGPGETFNRGLAEAVAFGAVKMWAMVSVAFRAYVSLYMQLF